MMHWLMKQPPWIYSILTAALIIYLTLTPHPLPDNDIPVFVGDDLVVHAIMFGSLYIAIVFDYYRNYQRLPHRIEWLMGAAAVVAGALVEVLQALFIDARSGDVYDFIADIAGVVIAALLVPVAKKVLH